MHYNACVILPKDVTHKSPEDEISAAIDVLMAPFDEDEKKLLPVNDYDNFVSRRKKTLANYQRLLKTDERQLTHEGGFVETLTTESLEYWVKELSNKTPDEAWQDVLETYEHIGENGNPCDYYNPEGHWDYYGIGGRWDGWLSQTNMATTEEAAGTGAVPRAIVTPNGEWHEQIYWDWYGGDPKVTDPEWGAKAIEIYKNHPGQTVVCLDVHC